MASYEVEQVSPIFNNLGEGPHWDIEKQSLYYIDIYGGTIHRYDYNENKTYTARIDGENVVSFIIPVEGTNGNEFAVGLFRRLAVITWDGKAAIAKITRIIGEVDTEPEKVHNRFNDGKADPFGRFHGGTMRLEEFGDIFNSTEGRFYRYTIEEGFVLVIDKIGLSNGLAWNETTNKFYYIDTCSFEVKEFDYDPKTGNICNQRQVISFIKEGVKPNFGPDGMTIDSEGFLYVALWNGSKVLKINPVNGNIELEINLPCAQITSVAFGGPNLDVLFITSAATTRAEPQAPLAGALFKVTGLKAIGTKMAKVRL